MARRKTHAPLQVLINGRLVGRLEKEAGGAIRFAYHQSWLEWQPAFAISLSLPLREAREQFERAYLQQQLVLCDGKVGKLAKRVGMERTHLYRKLRSLGVDFRAVSIADD